MLATAAATVLAGVSAPAALANSTLSVLFAPNGAQITVVAESGKVNDFEVELSNQSLTITDPADVIDATGCTGTGTNTVQCSFGPPITFLDVLANDLDDSIRLEMSGSNQDLLEGNTGSDELALVTAPGALGVATLVGDDGPPQDHGNDTLIGGANGDGLRGGGGTDVLLGGAGNDFLDAEAGSGDRAEAGPGDDQVIWTVGQGTGQFLDGGAGFDELFVDYRAVAQPRRGIRLVGIDRPHSRHRGPDVRRDRHGDGARLRESARVPQRLHGGRYRRVRQAGDGRGRRRREPALGGRSRDHRRGGRPDSDPRRLHRPRGLRSGWRHRRGGPARRAVRLRDRGRRPGAAGRRRARGPLVHRTGDAEGAAPASASFAGSARGSVATSPPHSRLASRFRSGDAAAGS